MATAPLRNEVVEKEIAGNTYKIELLGAKEGKRLIAGLLRTFGPALADDNAVAKLCESLSDAQLDALCDTFAAKTWFSPIGRPEAEFYLKDAFDRHFSGKYGTMTLWLKACLEANYGNFLGELGVDATSLKEMLMTLLARSGSPMSTEPIGGSGASLRAAGGA